MNQPPVSSGPSRAVVALLALVLGVAVAADLLLAARVRERGARVVALQAEIDQTKRVVVQDQSRFQTEADQAQAQAVAVGARLEQANTVVDDRQSQLRREQDTQAQVRKRTEEERMAASAVKDQIAKTKDATVQLQKKLADLQTLATRLQAEVKEAEAEAGHPLYVN